MPYSGFALYIYVLQVVFNSKNSVSSIFYLPYNYSGYLNWVTNAVIHFKLLPVKVNEWIDNGTINKNNKPNILYVDVAGVWITDYCVDLNNKTIYNKQ